ARSLPEKDNCIGRLQHWQAQAKPRPAPTWRPWIWIHPNTPPRWIRSNASYRSKAKGRRARFRHELRSLDKHDGVRIDPHSGSGLRRNVVQKPQSRDLPQFQIDHWYGPHWIEFQHNVEGRIRWFARVVQLH